MSRKFYSSTIDLKSNWWSWGRLLATFKYNWLLIYNFIEIEMPLKSQSYNSPNLMTSFVPFERVLINFFCSFPRPRPVPIHFCEKQSRIRNFKFNLILKGFLNWQSGCKSELDTLDQNSRSIYFWNDCSVANLVTNHRNTEWMIILNSCTCVIEI